MHAKEFDVFSIPEPYRELLRKDCKLNDKEWADFEDEQTEKCRQNEKYGRIFYNIAVISLFVGLFFAIAPYNLLVAIIVSVFGVTLEFFQILK